MRKTLGLLSNNLSYGINEKTGWTFDRTTTVKKIKNLLPITVNVYGVVKGNKNQWLVFSKLFITERREGKREKERETERGRGPGKEGDKT